MTVDPVDVLISYRIGETFKSIAAKLSEIYIPNRSIPHMREKKYFIFFYVIKYILLNNRKKCIEINKKPQYTGVFVLHLFNSMFYEIKNFKQQ